MQIAMLAADPTAGESDQLRRTRGAGPQDGGRRQQRRRKDGRLDRCASLPWALPGSGRRSRRPERDLKSDGGISQLLSHAVLRFADRLGEEGIPPDAMILQTIGSAPTKTRPVCLCPKKICARKRGRRFGGKLYVLLMRIRPEVSTLALQRVSRPGTAQHCRGD